MTNDGPVLYSSGLPLTPHDTFGVELETTTGSRYVITWDSDAQSGTLTRRTAANHDEHPMSGPLRRDREPVPLIEFDRIDLGHRTEFIIDVRSDGILTIRRANATVRIEGIGLANDDGIVLDNGNEDVDPPADDTDDGLTFIANGVLGHIHPPSACADQPWGCWIHRPLPHALDQAPVRWRDDKNTAERICEHRIGHPDPQDAAYWWNTSRRDVTIHGCDGCCDPRPPWAIRLLPPGR